jgi:ferritin
MKLSQTLNEALNQQILIELENQNKYMQVQSYFESLQLKNLANFFKTQSTGENGHANLFMDHVNDRNGGNIILGEVDTPKINFTDISSVADFYELTEQQTTESIESLYDLALNEKSYIDLPFLQSMLSEQVEEEDTSQKLALNLKMVKDIVLFDATFEG